MHRLPRPGVAGQAICLILSLALAATASGWRVAIACAVIVALAVVSCAGRPGGAAQQASLAVYGHAAGPAALLLGDSQATGGIGLSAAGLAEGRGDGSACAGIVVAVSSFASSVSVSDLSQLLERIGLRGLGFALGVAVNMLPTIQRSLLVAYQALEPARGIPPPVARRAFAAGDGGG